MQVWFDINVNVAIISGGKILDNLRGKIRFENVFFTYPTRPHSPIFKDLSLDIQPGTGKKKHLTFCFHYHTSKYKEKVRIF